MKLFVFGITSMLCFPGVAQNPANSEQWVCISSSKCLRSDDPKPENQKFARTAKVGRWWTEEHGAIVVTFAATRIESDQNVFRLRGNAEIATNSVIVQAAEANYYWDTGEIDPQGDVRVKPIPYSPASGLRQFGVR